MSRHAFDPRVPLPLEPPPPVGCQVDAFRRVHRWSDGVCIYCGTVARLDVAQAHFGVDVLAVPPEGRAWLVREVRQGGDPQLNGLALWLAHGGKRWSPEQACREADEVEADRDGSYDAWLVGKALRSYAHGVTMVTHDGGWTTRAVD